MFGLVLLESTQSLPTKFHYGVFSRIIWVKVLDNFGYVCFIINEEGSDVSYMDLCLQRLLCMPRSKASHNVISVFHFYLELVVKFLFSSNVLIVYMDESLSIQSLNDLQLGLCRQ
jgi:hypothetical protein